MTSSVVGQALHVLRSDIGRLLPLLVPLAVIATLAGEGVLGERILSAASRAPRGILPLTLATLAAVTIQGASPSTDQAFWRTTPLRPAAVVLAKLVFILVFLWFIPLATEAVLFYRAGAGLDLFGVTSANAVELLELLLVAALLGGATKSLKHFLAASLALWLGTLVFRGAAQALAGGLAQGDWQTQQFIAASGWAAIALIALLTLYVTSRPKRVLIGALTGLALVLPISRTLPFDWTTTPIERPEPEVRSPYPGSADIDFSVYELARGRMPFDDGVLDAVEIELRPVDGGDGSTLVVHEGTTHFIGGPDELVQPVRSSRFLGVSEGSQIRAVPGSVLPLGRTPRSNFLRRAIVVGEEAVLQAIQADSIRMELALDAYGVEVTGALSLEPGSEIELPSGVLRIEAVARTERSLVVTTTLEWKATHSLRRYDRNDLPSGLSFAVRNARYGEYIARPAMSANPSEMVRLIGPGGLQKIEAVVSFDARMAERRDDRLPEDWFDDVEFLVLQDRYAGSLEVVVERAIEEWPADGLPVRLDQR